MDAMEVRIWDVGHGLSVWIRTPAGQSHWVDVGFNPDGDFSPSKHVSQKYPQSSRIDYLVISHPDKDHFDDLHNMIEVLGEPRVLLRNKSVPDKFKFDSGQFAYQQAFMKLDRKFTESIDWAISPSNPEHNGGIGVSHFMLSWEDVQDFEKPLNNSSIVMAYQYANTLIVLPGDIEEQGWELLYSKHRSKIDSLIGSSLIRILVAPHHGRSSGYSASMMEAIDPHLVIVSDDHGRAPTDRRFRESSHGLVIDGVRTRYISTKSNQRVLLVIQQDGLKVVNTA
jgi:beta-lactamase superfamily II metal-dependent hydrolase